MNDMTPAPAGHNGPPSPIDDALSPYGDYITEAEGWLDGEPVQDEAQMKSVDALVKQIKAAEKAVKDAKEAEVAPLYEVYKAALDSYKPTLTDLERLKKGLLGIVNDFKVKLQAQRAEAERKARAEAEAKAKAAHEAAMKVSETDIEAVRESAAKQAEAEAAQKALSQASRTTKDTKGLRTVKETVVVDAVQLARHLWQVDREAQLAFQADRARQLALNIPGVVEIHEKKVAW